MEWHSSDVANLHLVDQQLTDHPLTSAEREILRRVIYTTGDFDYLNLLVYSEQALESAVAALAAHTPIVVDVPMVQVGILPQTQVTFANPIYCGLETFTRPQKEKSRAAFGVETLARRHPTAIFIIGGSQSSILPLLSLVESEDIKPALIVDTSPSFLPQGLDRLQQSWVPHIFIKGTKGGVAVAAAIINGLIELAWSAYGQEAGHG